MEIGYHKDLLILAFDHRGSFQEKMFGIKGRPPTAEEGKAISSYKHAIYEGFATAVKNGAPKEAAGILIDEQFGREIALAARKENTVFAMSVEKSGQDEFDFEYGEKFGEHIVAFQPTFSKVLVRFNAEADNEANQRQLVRLKRLNDWLHGSNRKLLFELLVPATKAQLDAAGGDKHKYDQEIRPKLMVAAMAQIQRAGIMPDVWKLEGLERKADLQAIVVQGRANGTKPGIVVLGRGESAEKVRDWLTVGAKTQGVSGFAVGRTIFWEPLEGMKQGKWARDAAVAMIANNYKSFVDLWMEARK
jgi:myo-inositol catabolism protein IolC